MIRCEAPCIFMYTSGTQLQDQWFINLYSAFYSITPQSLCSTTVFYIYIIRD